MLILKASRALRFLIGKLLWIRRWRLEGLVSWSRRVLCTMVDGGCFTFVALCRTKFNVRIENVANDTIMDKEKEDANRRKKEEKGKGKRKKKEIRKKK